MLHLPQIGLNRTSVGLKPGAAAGSPAGAAGLNRTSVGLKRMPVCRHLPGKPSPQSNQRGIETKARFGVMEGEKRASIEPAWD